MFIEVKYFLPKEQSKHLSAQVVSKNKAKKQS